MAEQLPQPGVEVIQEIGVSSPTILQPTLVPFVCGPAKEVIEATLADGTLNTEAKQGIYDQLPQTITQSAFPSPRGNILEVDVEEATIKVFFLDGGVLRQLNRDPGESFLTAWNESTQASIQTLPITAGGLALDGLTLVLAINVTARLNTTKDVAITFAAAVGGGNLTAQEVADQINNAVGSDVAKLVPVAADNRVQIDSLVYGARASVTVRRGGSANTLLGFDPNIEFRVEGAGFRGQDQQNNTTVTPWVEWTRGLYIETDASDITTESETFPAITAGTVGFGLIDQDGVFANTVAPDITFTGPGSIDLQKGDDFWADGVKPSGASVKKVEAERFKLGTLNTTLSVFDESGNVVSAVFDDAFVNTLFSSVPFSPRYAWFQANNLELNPAATAAEALGSTLGNPAEQAVITSGVVSLPAALTGLTLVFVITVDGVETEEQILTFSAPPFATVAEIATVITGGVNDIVAIDNGGALEIATTRTGAGQAIRLRSVSTALAALNFPTGADITATGKDVEFVNIPAVLVTAGNVFPLGSLPATDLVINISSDGGATFPTQRTHTFGAGPFNTITDVVNDINGDATFTGTGADLVASPMGDELALAALVGGVIPLGTIGSQIVLEVDATSTAIAGAGLLSYTSGQQDVGEDEIVGRRLRFQLNDRTAVYDVTFTSNSLIDAIDAINTLVGFPVASAGGTTEEQLLITSTLEGFASKVTILADAAGLQAARAFGFGSTTISFTGSGRPNPDFFLDASGSVVLGAEIIRSPLTGAPLSPGEAEVYIQYTALRKDVSPSAANPALLNIPDTTTLQNVLNPINSNNPLGLGMFFEILNAPNLNCTGMGVDEVSAGAPDGTLTAYVKVAEFIESKEIYAIAPLTHDETVAQAFKAHVELMSSATQKGERILFFNPLVPDRAVPDIVVSGLNGESTATDNQFVLDVNPVPGLNSRGINTAVDIPVSENLYLELAVATPSGQEVRRYSVKHVNSVLLELRTTFASGENDDAFFTLTPLTETLVNADWTLAVRGAELLIPGSNPPLPDLQAIAETVATKAAAYKQRRLYYVFPDKVKATVSSGLEEILPAYYACAAYTGLVAAQPPQQGFTNFPLGGFTGVVGSNDRFSRSQLDTIAAGGVFILIQEAQGAPIISRHQLSTNALSVETRELSITKIVDFVAKFKRGGLRNFIGTFNITQPFLDTLSTVIHGMNQFLIEQGVLIGADLNNLIQSKEAPDTVLVDETLDPPFPCNYIRLTLAL